MLHLINKPINISAGEQVDIFTWMKKDQHCSSKHDLPPNEFIIKQTFNFTILFLFENSEYETSAWAFHAGCGKGEVWRCKSFVRCM